MVQSKWYFKQIIHNNDDAEPERQLYPQISRKNDEFSTLINFSPQRFIRKSWIFSRLQIPILALKHQIFTYQWRSKTQYPIVCSRLLSMKCSQGQPSLQKSEEIVNKLNKINKLSNGIAIIQVQTETVKPLSFFLPLTFSQMIYSLRQSAVGFQRLVNHFGFFQLSQQLIKVNGAFKIKVWTNSNMSENRYFDNKNSECNQQKFIRNLVRIFYNFSETSMRKSQFINFLSESKTFLELIKHIDFYIFNQKIRVVTNLKNSYKVPRPNQFRSKEKNIRVPRFLSPNMNKIKSFGSSERMSPSFSKKLSPKNIQKNSDCNRQQMLQTSGKSTNQTLPSFNLIRNDKLRKGSGSNFCFKSLKRLQVKPENKMESVRHYMACSNRQDMNLKSGNFSEMDSKQKSSEESLIKSIDHLFAEGQASEDVLSISISIEPNTELLQAAKPLKLGQIWRYTQLAKSIINVQESK